MELVLSITVMALSILVMFLLGWQIYIVFNLNKIVNKKIRKSEKELEKVCDQIINKKMSFQYYNICFIYQELGKRRMAVSSLIDALDSMFKSNDEVWASDFLRVSKSGVINAIPDIKEDAELNSRFSKLIYQYNGCNKDIVEITQLFEKLDDATIP